MPISKSAKKSLKQSQKRRIFNLRIISDMKAKVKNLRQLINDNKKDEALKSLSVVYKTLDKAAKRGIIEKNNASRKKSRFSKAIAKIGLKTEPIQKTCQIIQKGNPNGIR